MTSPRLCAGPRRERQCQVEPSWHAADAHERAMDRLIGRDTAGIARELGIARRTAQSWRDRDGEHRGPGRLLAQAIRAALAYGRDLADALAPLAVVADEHGCDVVPRQAGSGDACGVLNGCAEVMREVGEAISAATTAARDGRITPGEVPVVEREINDAVQRLHALLREVQASARGGRVVEIGR